MSHVTFYLMSDADDPQASAVERLACQLSAESWGAGHIYLLCNDEAQALRLDELLWQLPAERFVPHQLQGESGMAPVEIGYQPPKRRYARLINLANTTPLFAGHFAQVVDFVPTDEIQKQQARERYKHYRQAGHTLEMRDAPLLVAADPAQP
ncbi:MAG: DNA polymerase III subunit chi [Aeromonas sp.]